MNNPSSAGPPGRKQYGTVWFVTAVAGWAVVIFILSSGWFNTTWTYRLLGRTFHLVGHPLASPVLLRIDFLLRKLIHVTEYALLTILLYRLLRPSMASGWHAAAGRLSVLGSALYAACDELHQWFVPRRHATVRDWFIDMAGVGIGISTIYLWTRFSSAHRKEKAAGLELAAAKQSEPASK